MNSLEEGHGRNIVDCFLACLEPSLALSQVNGEFLLGLPERVVVVLVEKV